MRTYRPLRVGGLIQEELAKIIVREIDFPEGMLVTLSNVEISPDMEKAKAGISVIPTESSAEALKILTKRTGYLQHLLNRKLNIRPMPRVHFEIDYGPANAAEVEKLLLKK
ncbi:MAG: 30S ribosome-binding factor RbfA [Candidatus Colwellbacteria bacterium]|nr:30S ribosome-binding factor RbfA [Candidatus Colwellbacteria bacterium]